MLRIQSQLLITICLCACFAWGCGQAEPDKADTTTPAAAKRDEEPAKSPSSRALTSSSPTGPEAPEVTAFLQKKGWRVVHNLRFIDGLRQISVTPKGPDLFDEIVLTDEECRLLSRSNMIEWLNLENVAVTDANLQILAQMPHLKTINNLMGNAYTDEGLKALAKVPSLEEVSVSSGDNVTDDGVRALAALPNLRRLDLHSVKLSGSCLEAFAGKESLVWLELEDIKGFENASAIHLCKIPNLQWLTLKDALFTQHAGRLNEDGIRMIVQQNMPAYFTFKADGVAGDLLEDLIDAGWLHGPNPAGFPLSESDHKPASLADVKKLKLNFPLKATDLVALSRCPGLEELELDCIEISAEGLKRLEGLKSLKQLSLKIRNVELTEESFQSLGKLTALKKLSLYKCQFESLWLTHITGLKNLEELDLSGTPFDDTGVVFIDSLPRLKSINLLNTQLTDAGFRELLKIENLKNIGVAYSNVTNEARSQARKDYPDKEL